MKNLLLLFICLFLFTGCFQTKPQLASSATILIKTPTMKFYDRGFIYKYDTYTQIQVFSAGTAVLDMKIYEDRVCTSTFECQDLYTFNKQNLHESYDKNFLKDIFDKNQKDVVHRDRDNRILIKILKD